jgi:hypothetical protein
MDLRPLFARHETFHPRVGWLTKAVDAAALDPYVFTAEHAPVELGVGKNMVRAIRYWGLATKVVVEVPAGEGRRVIPVAPTRLGRLLLGSVGWDRYIEDPRTLWLLHWNLLHAPVAAPVWWWAFNEFDLLEFDESDLERFVGRRIAAQGWLQPAASSVAKDVDCLVRMYGKRTGQRGDEWLDSPFATLGLLERLPGPGRRWRFSDGPKETLERAVIGIACLDAMEQWSPAARTVSLARLGAAPGGPGRAFHVSEVELAAALRELSTTYPQLTLSSPGGLTQLATSDDPGVMALRLLLDLYGGDSDDLTTVFGQQVVNVAGLTDAA